MTIIEELEKLLHEHQDLTAMVSGQLLVKDLRELVRQSIAGNPRHHGGKIMTNDTKPIPAGVLPELPEPVVLMSYGFVEATGFTADQMRAYATEAVKQSLAQPAPAQSVVPDVSEMVNRFLAWKLPKSFCPDAGITFKPYYNENTPWPMKHEPTGTNLFNAVEAKAMFEYCLQGSPPTEAQRDEQELFERGFKLLGVSLELNELGDYKNHMVQFAWEGWQAHIQSVNLRLLFIQTFQGKLLCEIPAQIFHGM